MKKLLAITLLIVHLFNLSGYSFLFRYLSERSTAQLSSKIDEKNYRNEDLVEIKVPLNLPSQISLTTDLTDSFIELHGKPPRVNS